MGVEEEVLCDEEEALCGGRRWPCSVAAMEVPCDGLAWRLPRREVRRRMRHAVELGGRPHGHAAFLLLPELRGLVELRAKVLHRLRLVPTTASPSGVVLLLVCVVVEV